MHEITLIPEDDPGFRVEPIAEIKTWVPKPVADSNITWADLIKNDAGLIPVIVRDYENDDLLMMAWMDEDAYEKTLETGYMTYHSRSRNALWVKGETSGHYQKLVSLTADCDLDTLSAQVYQTGAACHTGNRSCFFNVIRKAPGADDKETDEKPKDTVSEVETGENGQIFKEALESINTSNTFAGDVLLRDLMVINDRKQNPAEGSYTNYLFDKGIDKILKKVGEEASEIIISAKNGDNDETVYEIGDFLYHLMVLMANEGITWEDVFRELENRENDRQSS
ncbi:MAG: bifunctional phosphoribosyl-AMP cyclohydrolase/phosphoribosyl-ATP diphosphatase HisIE [Lachnospiraceae bacterium]|nr:bifunctional phosphoribosyl-AMP cyclohydrolase/phosphoribosyl-ATP diphosphatase HisIE [Lachnospiraceae bacterium]